MKAVVQRVLSAAVEVDGQVVGSIGRGLLVYVGVAVGDQAQAAAKLAVKVAGLRIFEDGEGKLNLSLQDVQGGVLAIPNFTLLADARKGRRPAFVDAAGGDLARPLFDAFVQALRAANVPVAQGRFGASMKVTSEAIGPINILLDLPPSCGQENS